MTQLDRTVRQVSQSSRPCQADPVCWCQVRSVLQRVDARAGSAHRAAVAGMRGRCRCALRPAPRDTRGQRRERLPARLACRWRSLDSSRPLAMQWTRYTPPEPVTGSVVGVQVPPEARRIWQAVVGLGSARCCPSVPARTSLRGPFLAMPKRGSGTCVIPPPVDRPKYGEGAVRSRWQRSVAETARATPTPGDCGDRARVSSTSRAARPDFRRHPRARIPAHRVRPDAARHARWRRPQAGCRASRQGPRHPQRPPAPPPAPAGLRATSKPSTLYPT